MRPRDKPPIDLVGSDQTSRVYRDIVTARPDGEEEPNFPITQQRLDARRQRFIDSIDEDAICSLVSQLNAQRPCSVLGHNEGSHNASYFVRFDDDDTDWVVKIPIEPLVYNAWDKVQSEAATLQYILDYTEIPVPKVRAFGKGAKLTKGDSKGQAFLVYDYIPGETLDVETLETAEKSKRRLFFRDVFNMLLELRKLKLATGGSLMRNDEHKLTVCGAMTMAANDLHIRRRERGPVEPFTTEKEYLAYQFRILSETSRLPSEAQGKPSREKQQRQVFALDQVGKLLDEGVFDEQPEAGDPFVLLHPDLKLANILVSEDLRVQGIIDWQFAITVPSRFWSVPPWILGLDHTWNRGSDFPACYPPMEVVADFDTVLHDMGGRFGNYANMITKWYSKGPTGELGHHMSLGEILRCPKSLYLIYFSCIFVRTYQGNYWRDVVRTSFASGGGALGLEVEKRIQEHERFLKHLVDTGVYILNRQHEAIPARWFD